MHLLRGGTRPRETRVVLRRYVRPEARVEEPDVAEREARTLRYVAGAALPTPQLLALDATGAEAGAPALVMSLLPGRAVWAPEDTERWVRGLAAVLPALHATAVPPDDGIRPFSPYRQLRYDVPAWSRRRRVWEDAIAIVHRPPPGPRIVVVHRDHHPGNVLWHGGSVSGVVDWQSASVGPPSLDVGHCRWNLLSSRHGTALADRFTAAWEQLTGERYDPWADVVAVIGDLDGARDDPPPHAAVVADFLARAVAELGGGTG